MRECTDIHESQFGFMPGRSTTDRAVSRGTEGHLCNLHRPREGLRPSPEGGDLENHEGEAGARKNMLSWSKTCTPDAERRCAQSREKTANSMLRLAYTRDLP